MKLGFALCAVCLASVVFAQKGGSIDSDEALLTKGG